MLMIGLWLFTILAAMTDLSGGASDVFDPMALFLLSMLTLLLVRHSQTKWLKGLLVILSLTALFDFTVHLVNPSFLGDGFVYHYIPYGIELFAIGILTVKEMGHQRKKETFAKALGIFNDTVYLEYHFTKHRIHLYFSEKFKIKYGVKVHELSLELNAFKQFLSEKDHRRFDKFNDNDLLKPSFNALFDVKFPGMTDYIPMLGQNAWVDHRIAFAVLVDMTDIRQMQSELSGMREAYHFTHEENVKIFENTQEIIAKYDTNGHVVFATESYADIYKARPAEIVGKSVHDLNRKIGHNDTMWFKNVLRDGSGRSKETMYRVKGETKWVRWSNEVINDENKEPVFVLAMGHDITALKNLNAELEKETIHDTETGLLNRKGFIDRMEAKPSPRVIYFIEIGNFSDIRDYYGLSKSKRFMWAFASKLLTLEKHKMVVGHYGYNEYLIAFSVDDVKAHEAFKQFIHRMVFNVLDVEGTPINLTVNLGYAIYPDDAGDINTAISNANIAMVEAKNRHMSKPLKFRQSMLDSLKNRFVMIEKLKKAMKDNAFETYFQPLINTTDNRIWAYEALSRWNVKTLGNVSPGIFLELAVKSRLMADLDMLLMRNALEAFAKVRNGDAADLRLTINVFKDVFLSDNLFVFLNHELDKHGLHPRDVIIELNENMFIEDLDAIVERISDIRDDGFKIAIDDFGKHFSSLSVLTKIPFDIIKIDRLFVNKINERENEEIIRMVLSLAEATGRWVVAEGVETEKQVETLRKIGCVYHQGFLYGKPTKMV